MSSLTILIFMHRFTLYTGVFATNAIVNMWSLSSPSVALSDKYSSRVVVVLACLVLREEVRRGLLTKHSGINLLKKLNSLNTSRPCDEEVLQSERLTLAQ